MADERERGPNGGASREPAGFGLDQFRLLVESVRDYAIFVLDTNGIVRTWNLGAQRIKGYEASEIIGQHFSAFYLSEDKAKCAGELEIAEREGRFEDEGLRVRKDGSRFWANVVITALRNEAGVLVGFAKVTRDLTERHRAEEQRIRLAQSEEANRVQREFLDREREARRLAEEARTALSTTLASIGDGVIATDAGGLVTVINPVAERLSGWTADEAIGRPFNELFRIVDEVTNEPIESPIDRALREGKVVELPERTSLLRRARRRGPDRG